MNGTQKEKSTHAACEAERGYDIKDEARSNTFISSHTAECDRKYCKDEQEKEKQEVYE